MSENQQYSQQHYQQEQHHHNEQRQNNSQQQLHNNQQHNYHGQQQSQQALVSHPRYLEYERGDSEIEFAYPDQNVTNPHTLTRILNTANPISDSTWIANNGSEFLNTLNAGDNNLNRGDTLDRNPGFVDPNDVLHVRTEENQTMIKTEEQSTSGATNYVDGNNPQNFVTVLRNIPVEVTQDMRVVEWQADQQLSNFTVEVAQVPQHESAYDNNDPTGLKPSMQVFAGDYNFKVQVQNFNRNTKNKHWDYSAELRKLFIDMGKKIQLSFATSVTPPEGAKIRLLPVYALDAHYSDPVTRCPNHASPSDGSNKNFPEEHTYHLIRPDHEDAIYAMNGKSKRLSILVPYDKPQVGTSYCSHMFKFMCLGSDVGGINRRPVKVIFTLENVRGEVLGRDQMDVRICSCPKRDKAQEEDKAKVAKNKAIKLAEGLAKTNSFSALTRPPQTSNKKRKLAEMEEFVMVPVARADFEKINEFAEAAVTMRNFGNKEQIKMERKKLLEMHNKKHLNKPR